MHNTAKTVMVLGLTVACAAPLSCGSGGAGTTGGSPSSGSALRCAGSKAGVTRLYWGDLHVHTNYSFDAYYFNDLSDPKGAFAFARGAAGSLPCTDPKVPCASIKLDVPLDFTAVTDHSELIGGLASYCGEGGKPPTDANTCTTVGQLVSKQAAAYALGNTVSGPGIGAVGVLIPSIKDTTDTWSHSVAFANEADDPCKFTAFVGYEYTGNPNGASLHRNIVFNGDTLPTKPVSSLDVANEWEMWNSLDASCKHDAHCDYVSIPHSANLSEGRMSTLPATGGAPAPTQAQIEQRARADVLVEITQHKGNSECQLGYSSPLSSDEESACTFENAKPICKGLPTDPSWCKPECTSPATDTTPAVPASCTSRLDMVRDTLVEGLKLQKQYQGVNPYKFGLVGASDTHNGDPGNVREDTFRGHGGILDATPDVLLGSWECADGTTTCATSARVFNQKAFRLNPGGITGVWAEENTRASLFAALQRREVFATSGPRIAIRMYASWGGIPSSACTDLESGHDPPSGATGLVAMGADLPARVQGKSPQLVVRAVADPILGTPLQRVEVIKGWVDASGAPHAKVFAVTGGSAGPAPGRDCVVDRTSQPEQLCGTWTDPEFDPAYGALYYARVLENPTCRWSTWMCVKQGVQCSQLDPATGALPGAMAGYEGCCAISESNGTYSAQNRFDVIEERGWTSPVWYQP